MRRAIAVAALSLLLLASCSDDDATPADTTAPDTTRDTATTTSSITEEAPDSSEPDPPAETVPPSVDDLDAASIVLTRIADLDEPIGLVTRDGSPHLYVAERAGRIQVLDTDGASVGGVLLDITGDTLTGSERGLLGVAFSPDGSRLYLSFSDRSGGTRVDEWAMNDDAVDLASRRTVYRLDQPFPNHNGGHITFGPDGMFYLGLGDGGGGGDPLGSGQDPTTTLGSLVRIDPTPHGDSPYTIPADNPFADGGGAPEIWAIGLRNPWRFTFDRHTNDLWIADVGQNAVEEITVLFAEADGSVGGREANLGWAIFEGDQPFEGGPEPENYAPPLHTYRLRPGCSITGGFVVRDPKLPTLTGAYLYSDFCDPHIHAVLQRDGEVVDTRTFDAVPGGQVASFGEGPGGELYVLSLSGGVFRIDAG